MKKFIIVFLIIAIPLGLVAGFLYDYLHNKKTADSEGKPLVEPKKMPSETTKEYKDASGFSFEIPDDIDASASSTLDNATYADITFTTKTVPGSVDFVVSDTKLTINDWLREQNASGSAVAADVKLGSLMAKEIKMDRRVKTGVIDQNILFELSVQPEKEIDYWKKVYEKILETFSFVNPQSSQPATESRGSESDIIYEGEEVIE